MAQPKRRALPASSNSWLILSLLLLFFFVYQISVIFSVVSLHCAPLEAVWKPAAPLLDSPFWLFVSIFIMFGVWMLVEAISSHLNGAQDRWFCSWVGVCVLACIAATLMTFRAHWEYYEVKAGHRTVPELTFQLAQMGRERHIDPWHVFLRSKQCEDPRILEDLTDEQWQTLRKAFVEQGGVFN